MNKKWQIYETNETEIEKLSNKYHINKLLASILINRKIKEEDPKNEIVMLYQDEYVPNMQKAKMPESIEEKIKQLKSLKIVIKDELEDLYNRLTNINNILEACNRNWYEATRVINSGRTPLGNIKISRQGLIKVMKNYDLVKKKYEENIKDKKRADYGDRIS